MPFGGALTAGIVGGSSILSSLFSGIFGNKAASMQAAAAYNGANNANQTLTNQYNINRADATPYTNTGAGAATKLGYLLGVIPQGGGAGSGAPGASLDITTAPDDVRFKDGQANWLQDWLDGKHPMKDGQPMGNLSNPASIAQVQAQIAQDRRDVDSWKTIQQDKIDQAGRVNSQDPSTYGSLNKNFTLADFQADPGYNFRLSEGQKALERSAAAKGGLFSGGTLKDLTQYNQNFASNEFTNAYNRYQTDRTTNYNMLAGAAGLGQTSANLLANLGQNTSSQIANNTNNAITDAANARASAYGATANAITGGLQGLTGILGGLTGGGQVRGTPTSIGAGTYGGGMGGIGGGGGIGAGSGGMGTLRYPSVIIN
jgi:hypothetical protein